MNKRKIQEQEKTLRIVGNGSLRKNGVVARAPIQRPRRRRHGMSYFCAETWIYEI